MVLTCPTCGWKGTFYDGWVKYYDALQDSTCPDCEKMLAIVPYPTLEESVQNLDKLTDKKKQEVTARKNWLARYEAASLKSVSQLPELEGDELSLEWDMIEAKPGENITLIWHGDREVWRELTCYEGYERFQTVVAILKEKYGQRLVDVVPTDASTLYLYGDKLSAIGIVDKIRQSLRRAV